MQVVTILRSIFIPVFVAVFSLGAMYAQAAEHPNALKITGSTTVEKALLLPNLNRIRTETGLELELQCKGTGPGLLKLAAGFADASGASETLADSIASATKRAVTDRDPTVIPSNLVYSEILHDRIVVIVNAKNTNIKQLNKQQLAEIFTQKIVNWQKVGGNDEYITLFVSPVGAATRALFQKVIMDGAEFPDDHVHKGGIAMVASTTARAIDNVGMVPDSIAAVSESVLNAHPKKSSVRVVETPVMDHPLALITVGNPSAKVQKLIDFLRSTEGKIK